MTESLIQGDHISCSRVGGAMRHEAAQLRRHAQALADALDDLDAQRDLAAGEPPDADTSTTSPAGTRTGATATSAVVATATSAVVATATSAVVASSLRALLSTADDLDRAGAALQRFATDLAQGHELGRRAERRVREAGLLLDGTRVIEPWGPASAPEAERRLAELPEVQSRVDLATAHTGRARGRLAREMTRLTESLSALSLEARLARQAPLPPHRT